MNPRVVLGSSVVFLVIITFGLHSIDEGYVGVYWRGGALLNTYTEPGYHFMIPLITSYAQVQISVQTDHVNEIPCGTSGGVAITFESIEVVNRLTKEHVVDTIRKYSLDYDKIWIFDKIHHEINQFCSSHTLQEVYIDLFDRLDESLAQALQTDCNRWAPGIEIIATRVTKPRIPDKILKNFEAMEVEKTNLLISVQQQKVIQKEAETAAMAAKIQAEKQAQVSKITMEMELMQKLAAQRVQTIQDTMHVAREKALADADFYKQKKLAEANTLRLSPELMLHDLYTSLTAQPKVFYGSNLSTLVQTPVDIQTLVETHARFARGSPSLDAPVTEPRTEGAAEADVAEVQRQ